MNYNKIISFLFVSSLSIYNQTAKAQALNINDDTIFVNTEAEIRLIFPTLPTNFATIPVNSQYRIWDSPTGINLIAQSENYAPVTLLVTEAQRNHRFILIFKKQINDNELKLYYDYSTEKKLAEHVKETEFSRLVEPEKAVINIEPVKPEKKREKETSVTGPVGGSSNYDALLKQGDKDLILENYQSAKLNFEKAHTLRPNELIPLKRLETIINKLAEKEKSEQEVTEKKYLLLTEEAKNKIDQKKYTDARNIYIIALGLKPGDVYVTQQLQAVSNLLAEESAQTKKQKDSDINKEKTAKAQKELSDKQITTENNYDTAVKSADNFFYAGDYENAKREYSKALRFNNKDWPKSQINKINKIVSEQIAQANADSSKLAQQQTIASEPIIKTDSTATLAEIKRNYNLAIAMGKSSYMKNDLLSAKTFYEEALNLQPSQQLPKNQLKIINNKLEHPTKETELNNNYVRAIALADSQASAKAYDSAIVSYKQASLLKPLESYPWKQVKYIQSELAHNEKRKREEKERQYSDALTRGDKAVTDKKYDDAKSAYTEALTIHPENEYAKRRLEISSYQLEKARIDKLSQDSVKEVVPVKKSKSKRKRSS